MGKKKFCPLMEENITEDDSHPANCDYDDCKFNAPFPKNPKRRICILYQTFLDVRKIRAKIS